VYHHEFYNYLGIVEVIHFLYDIYQVLLEMHVVHHHNRSCKLFVIHHFVLIENTDLIKIEKKNKNIVLFLKYFSISICSVENKNVSEKKFVVGTQRSVIYTYFIGEEIP